MEKVIVFVIFIDELTRSKNKKLFEENSQRVIRLEDVTKSSLCQFLAFNNFYTSASIINNPISKKRKIVLNSDIDSNDEYFIESGGIFNSSDEIYKKTDGIEFSEEELRKHTNKYLLTKSEVLNNPIWLALFEEDRNLLQKYIEPFYQNNKFLGFGAWLSHFNSKTASVDSFKQSFFILSSFAHASIKGLEDSVKNCDAIYLKKS